MIPVTDKSFEVEVPLRFVGPIRLKDGSLFAVERSLIALHSLDGGRTWHGSGKLTGTEVGNISRHQSRPWSLIRLASGSIGLSYETLPTGDEDSAASQRNTFYIQSSDEGRTWSAPVRVTWPNTPANPTWLVQTRTGRLLLPNEYWYRRPDGQGMGICTVFSSDDEGRTWRESADCLFVCDNGGAVIGSAEVPIVAETDDGRLLMFARTELQRIAQSYSDDMAAHWGPLTLNELVASRSEIALSRTPATGDLLCVWNQVDQQDIATGFYRARLTSAISDDSGLTWKHFRTIVQSPGMQQVTQITDHKKPAFLRSPRPIPSSDDMTADEFWMVRAPRVKFIEDQVYLVYTHRIYTYPDHDMAWKKVYDREKLRVLPISWYFNDDT